MVIDTNDVFEEAELESYRTEADRDLTYETNFNRAFQEADFFRSAAMAYIVTSQPEAGQSSQSRVLAWRRMSGAPSLSPGRNYDTNLWLRTLDLAQKITRKWGIPRSRAPVRST